MRPGMQKDVGAQLLRHILDYLFFSFSETGSHCLIVWYRLALNLLLAEADLELAVILLPQSSKRCTTVPNVPPFYFLKRLRISPSNKG